MEKLLVIAYNATENQSFREWLSAISKFIENTKHTTQDKFKWNEIQNIFILTLMMMFMVLLRKSQKIKYQIMDLMEYTTKRDYSIL